MCGNVVRDDSKDDLSIIWSIFKVKESPQPLVQSGFGGFSGCNGCVNLLLLAQVRVDLVGHTVVGNLRSETSIIPLGGACVTVPQHGRDGLQRDTCFQPFGRTGGTEVVSGNHNFTELRDTKFYGMIRSEKDKKQNIFK